MDFSITFSDIPIAKPVQYKPEGDLRHPTLEGSYWYRYRDLSVTYGVPVGDIWKEGNTAEGRRDMTMEEWLVTQRYNEEDEEDEMAALAKEKELYPFGQ
jgi:hypothetical protein